METDFIIGVVVSFFCKLAFTLPFFSWMTENMTWNDLCHVLNLRCSQKKGLEYTNISSLTQIPCYAGREFSFKHGKFVFCHNDIAHSQVQMRGQPTDLKDNWEYIQYAAAGTQPWGWPAWGVGRDITPHCKNHHVMKIKQQYYETEFSSCTCFWLIYSYIKLPMTSVLYESELCLLCYSTAQYNKFSIIEFLRLKVFYAVLKVFLVVTPCCSLMATCCLWAICSDFEPID